MLGPYELHPDTYILTARHRPDAELQRAGHADLVETQNGETYMVYLCGRPLRNRGRCTLGRETAIQPMTWSADGWLRTIDGDGTAVSRGARRPRCRRTRFRPTPVREDFDGPRLPTDFQWLRSPWPDELFSLTARPGHLRLYGRETIGSQFRQALVARRQQSHCFSAATVVEFEPQHFQQMAGLVCYYNSAKFHYLYISHDEAVGKHLRVMTLPARPGPVRRRSRRRSPFRRGRRVHLRVEVDYERLRFAYRVEGERLAVAAAAVRREHPLRRSHRAGTPELHRRVRRDGLPGPRRHGACPPTSTTSNTRNATIGNPLRFPYRQ